MERGSGWRRRPCRSQITTTNWNRVPRFRVRGQVAWIALWVATHRPIDAAKLGDGGKVAAIVSIRTDSSYSSRDEAGERLSDSAGKRGGCNGGCKASGAHVPRNGTSAVG